MRNRIASLVSASVLIACAHSTPEHVLSRGGVVDPPALEASLRCPSGTVMTQGQTMGVQTAVWCERAGGIKDGPFVEWFENHQKKSAGAYRDGHRQGLWTFWLPNGQTDSQVTYEKGAVVQSGQPPAPQQPAAPAAGPAPAPAPVEAKPQ